MPKYSIIVPTYNRADLISKTINSVLLQSVEDFELIIVDDGSTDHTKEIVAKIEDPRIKYFYKKNEERGAARNYGAKMSTGQIITFLDSDDLLYKNHLLVAEEFSITFPNRIFWQGFDRLDPDGNIIKKHKKVKGTILSNLINDGNIMACMGVFIPRDIFLKYLFVEDRILAGSEDMELWLRIASEHEIINTDRVTSAIVDHDLRSVFDTNFAKLERRKLLMLKHVFATKRSVLEKLKNRIIANAYSYISLHGILGEKKVKKESLKYFIRAISKNPSIITKKRTWVIIKKLLF